MVTGLQPSKAHSILGRVHRRAVFGRRVRVLAKMLSDQIPAGASLLDIGCGDGSIARVIGDNKLAADEVPLAAIQGIEFAPRGNCQVACTQFDGGSIPFADATFEVCMFVDVLHHVPDSEGIGKLLSEARRVSKRYVLIKDHLSENGLDALTLGFMDWVGNRPHGVVLPYNYQSRRDWEKHFQTAGLKVKEWQTRIPLYPLPFSLLFGRQLHFIGILERIGS